MKNEKILYSQNKAKINDVKLNLSHCQNLIQASVTEFLKIEAPITVNELKGLFGAHRVVNLDNVNEFVKEKMVEGKEGSIKGLNIDTERLKEMIVLPDLTAIINTLEKFEKPVESETFTAPDIIYWDFYRIYRNGKVKIIDGAYEILTQSFKAYAETKEEKQRLAGVLKLCDALTDFKTTNPEVDYSSICNNLLIEWGNDSFVPNPHFINTGKI